MTFEVRDVDRYKRLLAVCRIGGVDLNGWLVREGWALAFLPYVRDYECETREERRGVWRGAFVPPWE